VERDARAPLVLALALAGLAAGPVAAVRQAPVPAPPTALTLAWSDEFDRDGTPDPARWGYERGFVRNQEAQWYQPENARVEGGLLIIEGRRERRANSNYQAGATDWRRAREFAEYTSASLTTRNMHSWQYGRFEMRGRIDTRAGLWPAFWTLGTAGAAAQRRRST
jgi:beta-glucanase (GH16 family)